MDELAELRVTLKALGARRRRLKKDEDALREEIYTVGRAASRLGLPQVELIALTGVSREIARRIGMSDEQLDAERAKRRKRSS
jgi:hypothetical protein